ncbi:hypothetical protein [Streptomyces sp. DH10]|nr:hypothetical protein [Streptomyces sp. DH10]MDG9706823.1 hypothetical protein [Streptomyces sp. DH10]
MPLFRRIFRRLRLGRLLGVHDRGAAVPGAAAGRLRAVGRIQVRR